MMYMTLVEKLGQDMDIMSHDEFEKELEELYSLGDHIKELPYCGLKKRHHHQYGTVKAWVKWKSFEADDSGESFAKGRQHKITKYIRS